jgi:hypothetical protein
MKTRSAYCRKHGRRHSEHEAYHCRNHRCPSKVRGGRETCPNRLPDILAAAPVKVETRGVLPNLGLTAPID